MQSQLTAISDITSAARAIRQSMLPDLGDVFRSLNQSKLLDSLKVGDLSRQWEQLGMAARLPAIEATWRSAGFREACESHEAIVERFRLMESTRAIFDVQAQVTESLRVNRGMRDFVAMQAAAKGALDFSRDIRGFAAMQAAAKEATAHLSLLKDHLISTRFVEFAAQQRLAAQVLLPQWQEQVRSFGWLDQLRFGESLVPVARDVRQRIDGELTEAAIEQAIGDLATSVEHNHERGDLATIPKSLITWVVARVRPWPSHASALAVALVLYPLAVFTDRLHEDSLPPLTRRYLGLIKQKDQLAALSFGIWSLPLFNSHHFLRALLQK